MIVGCCFSILAAATHLPVSMVNHLPGNASINAYITGLDVHGKPVLLQPDGTWYRPDPAAHSSVPVRVTADIAIPVGPYGSVSTVILPGDVIAGRIWLAVGTLTFATVLDTRGIFTLVEPSVADPFDPNADVPWAFIELTYGTTDEVFANLSYVGFVSLALGISLESADGGVQSSPGIRADAVAKICNDLTTQAHLSGEPWDQLCVRDAAHQVLRVLSPTTYISRQPTAFQGYYRDYVDRVWKKYSNQSLILKTHSSAGDVECTVAGARLRCEGDRRPYDKPTAADIFGCNSGPFVVTDRDDDVHQAAVPILCAAFTRSTLLRDESNVQPSSDPTTYYHTSPTNYYSKFVHDYEVDGKGYAFPYDDVNPTGENQAGLISSSHPKSLTITVGGR